MQYMHIYIYLCIYIYIYTLTNIQMFMCSQVLHGFIPVQVGDCLKKDIP